MVCARVALLGLALAATGCGGSRAPEELSGLWSAGPAACEAGVGVRFDVSGINAVYDSQTETLFAHPRYDVLSRGGQFRVRIVYDLPHQIGGARAAGAYGVLVLAQRADGGIGLDAHNLIDPRTGAARLRMLNDPAAQLLALQPCGPPPWGEGLRGRLAP